MANQRVSGWLGIHCLDGVARMSATNATHGNGDAFFV
jgi:hypothetical protein